MLQINECHTNWSLPLRYAVAVFIFLIALLLRFMILPVESGLAFLTFYPATVISFYLCGVGPSVLMVGLCAIVGNYVFMQPYWSFSQTTGSLIATAVYLGSAFLIGTVVKQLQNYSEQLRVASAALQQSEERHRHVLEDQLDMICRFRTDGTILYVNDAYCRFFGKRREELVGCKWHPDALSDDIPFINEQLGTLTPENPVVTIENRVVGGDGSIHWGQFINRAFFDQDGRILEMLAVARDITERKALEARLVETACEVEDLYNHAPCGYHSLNADGVYIRVNATELSWMGCSRDEVIGKMKPTDFFTPASQQCFQENFPRLVRDGHIEDLEFDLVGRDGAVRHVGVSATAIRDAKGQFLMSRSVMFDLTELKATRDHLDQVAKEQQAMLDNDLVGIMKVHDRRILWKNRAMGRIFGYEHGELVGKSTRMLYPDEAAYQALGDVAYPVLQKNKIYRSQVEMVRKSGERIWVDISGVLLSDQGSETLWMLTDITPLKRHEEQITQIAYHDILTGLPNRLLVADRLIQALAQAERSRRMLAVCYLDLDGFKPINDNYGHEAGDKLLVNIAHRLQVSVRANDTVGRLGGDEFVLILTDLENTDEHQLVLARVIDAVNRPIALSDSQQVTVGASIGISLFPADGSDPDMLLRQADQAMYLAKRGGRNQVRHYTPEDAGNLF